MHVQLRIFAMNLKNNPTNNYSKLNETHVYGYFSRLGEKQEKGREKDTSSEMSSTLNL